MSLRPVLVLALFATLAGASVAACGSSSKACGLNCGDDDGSGGSTGSGLTTTSSDGTGTTTSSTGSGSCLGCIDFLDDTTLDPSTLCTTDGPPSSATLAAGILDCACVEGPCIDLCADSLCNGAPADGNCAECLGSCDGYNACVNAQGTTSATSSSATGGGPCATCFEAITGQAMGSELCTDDGPPSSTDLFIAMITCACEGACADSCVNSLCATGAVDGPCQGCLLSDTGCATEAQACAGNGP